MSGDGGRVALRPSQLDRTYLVSAARTPVVKCMQLLKLTEGFLQAKRIALVESLN